MPKTRPPYPLFEFQLFVADAADTAERWSAHSKQLALEHWLFAYQKLRNVRCSIRLIGEAFEFDMLFLAGWRRMLRAL